MQALQIDTLTSLLDHLDPNEKNVEAYTRAMQSIRFGMDQVKTYCHFRPSFYTRNLIRKTKSYELIALCWGAGQSAPIHDHAGQDCWMYVVDGQLEELRYKAYPKGENLVKLELIEKAKFAPGQMFYINDDYGLHGVVNVGKGPAVSLHLYSKSIPECDIFDPDTGIVSRRKMEFFSIEGNITGA